MEALQLLKFLLKKEHLNFTHGWSILEVAMSISMACHNLGSLTGMIQRLCWITCWRSLVFMMVRLVSCNYTCQQDNIVYQWRPLYFCISAMLPPLPSPNLQFPESNSWLICSYINQHMCSHLFNIQHSSIINYSWCLPQMPHLLMPKFQIYRFKHSHKRSCCPSASTILL